MMGQTNAITTNYQYESIGTTKRISNTSVNYSNGQSSSTTYEYVNNSQVFIDHSDVETKDYLMSFGEQGGLSSPVKVSNYKDGTLVSGTLNYFSYDMGENKVKPKANFGVVSGSWQLLAKHSEWHESTAPTKTLSGLFQSVENFELETIDVFNQRTVEYNSHIQPEIIRIFDNNFQSSFQKIYGYDIFGDLEESTNENNIVSEYFYDEFGRLERSYGQNNRIDNEYIYRYNPSSVTTQTSFSDGTPSQKLVRNFNGLGMATNVIRKDGAELSSQTYDNFFRKDTEKTIGAGAITYTYESSPTSRLLSTSQGPITSSFLYSADGVTDVVNGFLRLETTDANGHTFISISDAFDRTVSQTSGAGGVTLSTYDAFDRVVGVINPIEEVYSIGYSPMGFRSHLKVPGAPASKAWYDQYYRLVATKSTSGAMSIIKYDNFNRPLETYLFENGGPTFGNDGIVDYEQDIVPHFNATNLVASNQYQQNKTWVSSTRSNNRNPDNSRGGMLIARYTRDNIGRVVGNLETFPDNGMRVSTSVGYNDNSQVTSTSQNYQDSDANQVLIESSTSFDGVLRPVDTYLKYGELDSRLVSRVNYDSEDRVEYKLLGHAGDNSFLQRVNYSYENATGRLLTINDPTSFECTSEENATYCDFTSTYKLFLQQECSVVITQIVIDGTAHPIPPVDLLNQDPTNTLENIINHLLRDLGHTGSFNQSLSVTSGGFVFIYEFQLSNADISSLEFVIGPCQINTSTSINFEKVNCCSPSDAGSSGSGPWVGVSNSPDLYHQDIGYDGLDISDITYSGDCYMGSSRYEFRYDGDHRISIATHEIFGDHPVIDGYATTYSYDPAGNILSLDRRGRIDNTNLPETAVYDQIDKLTYKYVSNSSGTGSTSQLESVLDEAEGLAQPFGFVPTQAGFGYDAAGNVVSNGTSNLTYNVFNLPGKAVAGDKQHELTYTNGGVLYRRRVQSADQTTNRFYINGLEVVDQKIEQFSFGDGRIVIDEDEKPQFQFSISDHLGNVVVLFQDKDENGIVVDAPGRSYSEVLQRNLYYPFGLMINGTAPVEPDVANRYRYNGKEFSEDLGLYDYGARWYDPAIGRWTRVDPLASQFLAWSPYNYVYNNPVRLVDPDGRSAAVPPGAGLGIETLPNGNFSHISVTATVYTYGPASSADVAGDLGRQVNGIWNNSSTIGGPVTGRDGGAQVTPIEFNISFQHVSVEEAQSLAANNTDPTVNFLQVIEGGGAENSFFKGNSGVLSLSQNESTGLTTAAHEVGHMMGFSSQTVPNMGDNTHFNDASLPAMPGGALPLMYSGGGQINNRDTRVRTTADVQGLNIGSILDSDNRYIGEEMTNTIYD